MIYLSLVQYVLHKFLTDICVVSCIRKFFLEKNLFIPLGSSSKLYHETDCHRFDEYKHKKPLWNHLRTAAQLKVPRKTSLWRFSKNTLTHS